VPVRMIVTMYEPIRNLGYRKANRYASTEKSLGRTPMPLVEIATSELNEAETIIKKGRRQAMAKRLTKQKAKTVSVADTASFFTRIKYPANS